MAHGAESQTVGGRDSACRRRIERADLNGDGGWRCSVSRCGERVYRAIDARKVERILVALRRDGATITGSNPWDLDTRRYGVRLRGMWDRDAAILRVIVVSRSFVVPCSQIWET